MRASVLLVGFFLSFAFLQANASAEDRVCDVGCDITTCGSTHCTIYECGAGTCSEKDVIAADAVELAPGYHSEMTSEAGADYQKSRAAAGNSGILFAYDDFNCGQVRCIIKSCVEGECSVIGFDQQDMKVLGVHEDTESSFNQLVREFMSAPRSQR